MQKITFLTISLLFIANLFTPLAQAQTATTPAEPDVNEVTENIRERLQETIGESVTDSTRLYGYLGVVKDIIKSTIVIEDKDGKKNIMVDTATKITRSPGNAEIKLDSVRIEDNIIAIGSLKGEEVQGTKLIVSASSFAPPQKVSGIGEIEKLTKSSLSITTASGSITLDVNSKTVIKSFGGLLEYSDLEVGDRLVYAATVEKDDSTATILYRVKSAN